MNTVDLRKMTTAHIVKRILILILNTISIIIVMQYLPLFGFLMLLLYTITSPQMIKYNSLEDQSKIIRTLMDDERVAQSIFDKHKIKCNVRIYCKGVMCITNLEYQAKNTSEFEKKVIECVEELSTKTVYKYKCVLQYENKINTVSGEDITPDFGEASNMFNKNKAK